MALRDDYLELNLYLEDYDEEVEVSLWVTCRNREMLVFHGVSRNPIRYHGVWGIDHDFVGQRVTSYLPAEDVWHFTVVNPLDNHGANTGSPLDEAPEDDKEMFTGFLVEL